MAYLVCLNIKHCILRIVEDSGASSASVKQIERGLSTLSDQTWVISKLGWSLFEVRLVSSLTWLLGYRPSGVSPESPGYSSVTCLPWQNLHLNFYLYITLRLLRALLVPWHFFFPRGLTPQFLAIFVALNFSFCLPISERGLKALNISDS